MKNKKLKVSATAYRIKLSKVDGTTYKKKK